MRIFHFIIFIVNLIAAFCLLLSYAAPFVNPEFFYPVAFFGLAFPFLLALNFLFVIYWLFLLKKRIFFSAAVIILGWNSIPKFLQFHFGKSENNSENSIKILSYNVRVFDLYNWTGNTKTRNHIFELIKSENADILCFQEFFHSEEKNYFNTLDTILQFQNARNFHAEYTETTLGKHHFGIATFSKFPIIKKGKVDLATQGTNLCIFSDIKINNDTIRVYNAHLASLHFKKDDYKFLEEITQVESSEQLKGIRIIIDRAKIAFEKRASQAQAIAQHISESPFPVVICGDFNDTPFSYSYRKISENLKDAFMESGNGIGATYIGKFSIFRIDYILHSESLISSQFETIPEELSDHYPITCNIHFPSEKK